MQQLDFNVKVCRLLNSEHSSLKFCNSRCDELSLMLKKRAKNLLNYQTCLGAHPVMKEYNRHLVEVKPLETLARQLFFLEMKTCTLEIEIESFSVKLRLKFFSVKIENN